MAHASDRQTRCALHRLGALCMLMSCLAVLFLAGCTALPSLANRSVSSADLDTGATRLGRGIAGQVAAHRGKSGVYPLADARDAFAARVLVARAAERTLDVQYYIWRKDLTGTLLFQALREAADRGVRVRLLLDDNNTAGMDTALAALDAHPYIEVRLFNPFVQRRVRALGYLSDFHRANRRMHNKSFTADSQATIIGGRNVGDEYFGATSDVLFADLDVLAVGPVVGEMSKDFDRYWRSDSSYPVDRLLPPAGPVAMEELRAAARATERSARAVVYMQALRDSPFAEQLLNGQLQFEWAVTRLISDDPAKGLGRADPTTLIFNRLKESMGAPVAELNLVSPYFVPMDEGVKALAALARKGVKVRVLTNALEATDVAAVHAGYAKHRKALLEAGIALYELRRASGATQTGKAGLWGSSASSLHSKTFAVDDTRAFVGSLNFDPRSARLNTEMGFVIDSPALAMRIAAAFAERIPAAAYEVRLSAHGQPYWLERRGGSTLRHEVEPGTSGIQRAAVRFMSMLPIDWLL